MDNEDPESESSQDSDSVENMEESCEDSDFLELVSQGRENHPLVKFTRLAQTKKSELEYHYNPDVERNKGKDMKGLWLGAKRTVDGGIQELQGIIKDRRKKGSLESETLKLEVVERDLQIISMKFEQHLTNKQKDEKFEVFRDFSAKTSDLNLGSIKSLIEKSLKSRKKLTEEFFCSKSGSDCKDCLLSMDQRSTRLPCSLEKAHTDHSIEGVVSKYAFLTCVRSKNPKQRELAITTFRDLLAYDQSDQNESRSDIQKMIGIHPEKMKRILSKFFQTNRTIDSTFYLLLTELLVYALKAMIKLDVTRDLDNLVQRSFLYQIETNLTETDALVYDSIMDQDGVFGFVSWFSKFLVTALSENSKYLLPAEMFVFNLEVCSPLVRILDYGSGSYPWFEALLMNFSTTLKHVWTKGVKQGDVDWGQLYGTFRQRSLCMSELLSKPALPRSKKYEICGECRKRINKKPTVYPLCFQGSYVMETYPREMARMERPEKEWNENVSSNHMDIRRRSVLLVCGPRCLLKAMSQMNPCLSEIVHQIIPSITSRTLTASSEPKLEEMKKYYADQIESAIIRIDYFNLRTVVETVFPPFGVKIVDGSHLDFEMKLYVRKKTIITMKNDVSPKPTSKRTRLPGPDFSESCSGELPAKVRDYFDNLLLHKKKTGNCNHQQVWGGWAKFHPLDNFTLYTDSLDGDGVSKLCVNFQLKLETCGQIDLNLNNHDGHQEMLDHVGKFKDQTLHLFSMHLQDSQVGFLRESCNKLVVSGPSNLDDVAIDKVFSNNIKCLLGLWESVSQGIILCCNPKTYFAFVPKSFPAFFNFLTFDIGLPVVWPLVRAFTKALVQNIPKSIQFDIPKTELSDRQKKSISESIYGFGIINIIETKRKFQEILTCDDGMRRFKEIHLNHHEGTLEKLSQEDNHLVRYQAKHLIGCKHDIKWKGCLDFAQDVYRIEFDPNIMIFQKSSCSAWAFHCRACLESLSVGREPVSVPDYFWKLMRNFTYVLMIKENLDPQLEKEKRRPIIVLELGSVNREVIEFLKSEDTTVLSFLSTDLDPRDMKYLIKYSFYDGKILGNIFDAKTETFRIIWESLRSHCWARNTYFCREFFGVTGVPSRETEGKLDFVTDRSSEAKNLFDKFLQYQCSVPPPASLLQTLGNVLWTGEMQTFLISNEPVRGFQKTNDYCKMAKNVITEAVRHVEQEDLGSLRNGPFLSPSGHFVYSNYAVITGSDTPDHHFRKCGETAVSLIAFNVERKVVEQCIGTFKKCFLYNLHIQDFDYFFSELRDSKTTMLAFLLEKDELVRDVLKMSPTDFSKRIFILKFDVREGFIKVYLPKEKDKMIQIWKCVNKTNLMTSHEKMFKKIKKPDKSVKEATVAVSVKNLRSVELGGGEVAQFQSVEISLSNIKTKTEKPKNPKEDKAETGIDLSQNLKKMFSSLAVTETEEPEPQLEKEKKVRLCWNCEARSDSEGVRLLKCQGCRRARYCNEDCQAEDWENHQEYCNLVQERREARDGNQQT